MGTLLSGVQPRDVGQNITREDFETRPESAVPLGLLAEVVDSLELEHDLEKVSAEALAANSAKIAIKVTLFTAETSLRCLEAWTNRLLWHRPPCCPRW